MDSAMATTQWRWTRQWTARRQCNGNGLDGNERQWTAQRQLESNGRCGAKAMDGAMAPRRGWTVQRQLKGK